jgi:uncharacterized protein
MTEKADVTVGLLENITLLEEGLIEFIEPRKDNLVTQDLVEKLSESLPVLEKMKEWVNSYPPERVRSSFFSLITSLDTIITHAVRKRVLVPEDYGATPESPLPSFLTSIILQSGPEIKFSNDRMKASAFLPEEFVHFWSIETLRDGIERQGIVNCIEKNLARILKNPDKLVVIAKGTEPERGVDAVIEDMLGLAEIAGKPVIENDKARYKELNIIINITEGQVIMHKTPAKLGTPGVNVLGEPIPCQDGKDEEFPPIPNTRLSEDGNDLLSTIDGCAYMQNGQVVLVPTLDIHENVDYSTGNVNASVAVTIAKDVLSGFKVESTKDIIVRGTAEGCKLLAKGNIFLPGGVQGKAEAKIQSLKNIDAKFLNEATVIAKHAIIVHGAVMLSKIRCHRLELDGADAEIKGGVIEAATDVLADTMGSEIGAKTVIKLGHDVAAYEETINKLEEDIQNTTDRIARFKETIASIEKFKKKQGALPPDKQALLEKVINNLNEAEEKLQESQVNLEKNKGFHESALLMQRTVRARKEMLPGVEIHIFGKSLFIKSPTGPATVKLKNDEVQVFPFEERHFEEEAEADIE